MAKTKKMPEQVIATFMANDVARNEWLECQHINIYVRKSVHRQVRGDTVYYRPCLQVANWFAKGRRGPPPQRRYSQVQRRQLVEFMRAVERAAVRHGYDGVYVENVLNETLQDALRRNRYEVIGGKLGSSPCYFKPSATIVDKSYWVSGLVRAAHERPHPPISAFAKDSSLNRFWVFSKATGIKIYLKRELIRVAVGVPVRRITVLALMRARSIQAMGWDHDVYTNDDREILCQVLNEIEGKFRGSAEIAVSARALLLSSRPVLGVGQSWRVTDLDWLVDAGYAYERQGWRLGYSHCYVKRMAG